MDKLDLLRCEIDSVDKELVKLFERRMEIVTEIGKFKEETNMPILNKSREEEVLKKNASYLKDEELVGPMKEFFKKVMEISRDVQRERMLNRVIDKKSKIKVGFQGQSGSFSEAALNEYFTDVESMNVETFEDVFVSLHSNHIDYGVLPIENSSTGGISEVYDLLKKYNGYIIGEVCLKVKHNLLGVEGSSIELLEEIYSHPQALEQSKEFLKKYPHIKLIPYKNTAISAKYIMEQKDVKKGAVASVNAAEIYNLKVLKENIHHNHNNYTRFVIIGKNPEICENANKVSVLVNTNHEAGALFNVLRYFADNDISMLKIESRPIIGRSWEYFFYIDFQGNIHDEHVKKAIKLIEDNANYFKLMGNYISGS
ncbi:chorismate mutase [Anaeromicrobium sediminis]|uniref:Bifunctional chorismate mutase/prephenate dehydratase n=1 Tax=Anaeromicrobium sediminis TaxID=1478221 RepID=A0A267MJU2_9FIRM|nr:chorismate mutase [Anaeromicrobium sediminis]PAB59839.1 chorismate mutase [Anaeromicrobium sediminis]